MKHLDSSHSPIRPCKKNRKETISDMKNLDSSHSLESLKNQVATFCRQRDWDKEHNPKDLAVGAVTEASELLEIFRFCSEEQSYKMTQDPQHRERISEELADTLCFLLRFAQLYQFDLSSCLKDKLNKNSLKYPAIKT